MSAALTIFKTLAVMALAASAAGTWTSTILSPGVRPGEGAWVGTFFLVGAAFLYRHWF